MTMSVQDIKMDLNIEIGSPTGMSQLIRYFEIQSQRLDRQSLVSSESAASCLNSTFESLIKFDRVPILAPAMTSSRREALKQHKKDAILLEKKLKMRQRRQLKIEMVQAQSKNPSQDTPGRSAARQLNFDSGNSAPESNTNLSSLRQRLGATNPLSTFATAETDADFGLQTLDSVNSDFMSLEEGALPTSFSGHTLRSLKEQKISYNLDHLCKELNVQDLGSTSGSDLSDALANTQMMLMGDITVAKGDKWSHRVEGERSGDGDTQGVSFCHESQDTVVEVSPEPGSDQAYPGAENSTTSGFVEKSDCSNLEQSQASIGSSPGCGSANTTDSQKSKVHFASFILEYNTSASQSLESTTVVKKKMSPKEVQEDEEGDEDVEEDSKSSNPRGHSIHSKSHEAKIKSSLSRKISDEGSTSGLLNRVSLQPDSESSPTTPPYEPVPPVPFQTYGSNEASNSDKENEGSRILGLEHSGTRHLADQGEGDRQRGFSSHGESQDHQSHSHRSRRKVNSEGHERGESSSIQNDLRSFTSAGVGPASAQTSMQSCSAVSVGASQMTSSSCDSSNLVSVSQVSLGLQTSGVGSVNKQSVSDSQASSRSTALTGTSGSSSSTIKEDLTPKNSTNLAMNIVEGGSGQVQLHNERKNVKERNNEEKNGRDKVSPSSLDRNNSKVDKKNNAQTHSPKRLNTDNEVKNVSTENKTPPKQTHIRRGSYTLSHPSPALIQARAQVDMEGEREKYEDEKREKADVNNQNMAAKDESNVLKKKLDFGDLIRDLEESSVDNINRNSLTAAVPLDPEKDGKAEHINKYLRHVQFQNSMNLNSLEADQSVEEVDMDQYDEHLMNDDDGNENSALSDDNSIIEVIRSIAESQTIMGKLSDLEVQSLHQQQMELARQALVEQQRKDMEELFVQQRREIMKFETEIRQAQQQSLEQHKFLVQNAPENLKVKARHHGDEYSPESTANLNTSVGSSDNPRQIQDGVHNTYSSINFADNMRPQSMNRVPFNDPHSPFPSLNLQPKSYPSMNHKTKSHHTAENSRKGVNASFHSNKSGEATSDQDYYKRDVNGDVFGHRTHAPHDPIEVRYGIPEFGSPSVSSPRMHRKMGFQYGDVHSRRTITVTVPPQAYHPEMKAKFDRLSAVAKGFLTRCLIRSDKVQELIKTIKDTNDFFINFQTETPIKNGNITSQDKALMDRLQAQLQGAVFDIHEIFFDLSASERMSLIEQTRVKEFTKRVKVSRDSTDVSRVSGPRMSQATMKALERKRKAREAETIAILSTSTSSSVSRPRTGSSSNNNSPRCQNHTDIRALKPLQGQQTHHHQVAAPNKGSSNSYIKEKKDKIQNAPDKPLTRPKRVTVPSSKQSHSSAVTESDRDTSLSKPTASTTAKVMSRSKVVPSSTKPTGRPSKSWR